MAWQVQSRYDAVANPGPCSTGATLPGALGWCWGGGDSGVMIVTTIPNKARFFGEIHGNPLYRSIQLHCLLFQKMDNFMIPGE